MESRELEISARARVAAMFLDWATVPILALPIPTSTSSGAFLRAFARLKDGIPPEAGCFEAQPETAAAKHTANTNEIIFFMIKHSFKYLLQEQTFMYSNSVSVTNRKDFVQGWIMPAPA
jgi:hypothetical protein